MYNLPTQASVVSNIAPKHYGVDVLSYNIESIDRAQPQDFDELSGRWGIRKMCWYIYQGDDLMRARPIEFDFFRQYPEDPSYDELQAESTLLECDTAQAPRYPEAMPMKTNCTLKTDLSVVPEEFFEKKSRRGSDGKILKWWELYYKLVVTIQSGPMLFSINCRGQQYGAVSTQY